MTNQEKRQVCLNAYGDASSAVRQRISADIEKYRKGKLRLTLRDANGAPYAGKKITLTQTSHDFKYGANIFMLDEFQEDWENAAYRDLFAKHFNLATVPFYWNDLEPEEGKPRFAVGSPKIYRRPATDLCVEYCRSTGILPKLHCLFYDKFLPAWLPREDEAAMRYYYEKRFAEIAERYAGKMYEFEVINEVLLAHKWGKSKSILSNQRGIIEWCFDLARKYFPGETLVLNEGGQSESLANEGYTSRYFLQLDMLMAKGTPIDTIGTQHHIFSGATRPAGAYAYDEDIIAHAKYQMNPEVQLRNLDMLGEFDRPIEITEVTVPTFGPTEEDEELQADIVDMLYSTWFSHKNMKGVMYWNTVDQTAFIQENAKWNENNCRGGLFRRDMTPKKSAVRLYEMFNKRWHTDLTLTTSEEGEVEFSGFYGEYTLCVEGKPICFALHTGMSERLTVTV